MGTHPIFESDFDCLTDYVKSSCVTGVLLMLHAAISIAHLRSIVRSRGQTETRLPFDILLECIIGFAVASFGATRMFGDYQDISTDASVHEKPIEAQLYRPGFYQPIVRRFIDSKPTK